MADPGQLLPRRAVLQGGIAAAALGGVAAFIAACGASGPTPASTPAATTAPATGPSTAGPSTAGPSTAGDISIGSSYSDAAPKQAMQAVADAFAKQTGIAATVNTMDGGTFPDLINTYLQGTPDDVFTWFAGYRMRFFGTQGLAADISDVWSQIQSDYSAAFRTASTGDDGKQYFIPCYAYPWVVIFRKSLFATKGYTIPATVAELEALGAKMHKDGLIPLAFGNQDGRPAVGVFDILDMRINGYAFHVGLIAGREKWTDPRVRSVFEAWIRLLPYFDPQPAAKTWQGAAQDLLSGKAGMCFLGTFAIEQAADAATRDDLDFFPFPAFGTQYDAEKAIDAPTDGFMVAANGDNLAGAKAFMEFAATPGAQLVLAATSPTSIAAAKGAATTGYSAAQQRIAEIIGAADKIAQGPDGDIDPSFAGPSGLPGFLQTFLGNPQADLVAFLQSVQGAYDALS